jgi:dolichyl-phosphate beta-glucosyltransferase
VHGFGLGESRVLRATEAAEIGVAFPSQDRLDLLSRAPATSLLSTASYVNFKEVHDVDVDIIIPALNEEHRISRTIIETCEMLAQAAFTARIIVVDNGSVDSTAEAVDAACSADVRVDVIGCSRRGKGAAVRAGVLYSSAKYIAYCDADLSTPPGSIIHAYEMLAGGWDAVIGSRRVDGAEYAIAQPFLRRAGSKVFSLAASRMVGGITDTQCGFKAFRADAAKSVFEDLITHGFAFDVEVIARLQQADYAIAELPISWSDTHGSSFRPLNDGVQAFRDLVSARRIMRVVKQS